VEWRIWAVFNMMFLDSSVERWIECAHFEFETVFWSKRLKQPINMYNMLALDDVLRYLYTAGWYHCGFSRIKMMDYNHLREAHPQWIGQITSKSPERGER